METTTIRIAVKGDAEQAEAAMRGRGVAGRRVCTLRRGSSDETFFDVPEAQRPVLVAWHCEPAVCDIGRGYPAGTLLFHG